MPSFVADGDDGLVLSTLGALRVECAKKLDIIKDGYNFLWVVKFPFFEYDKESGEWLAMHHPFTSPTDDCMDKLEGNKGEVYAKAYDMVLNGTELSSGSIRITNPDLQKKMFSMLGLSDEEMHRMRQCEDIVLARSLKAFEEKSAAYENSRKTAAITDKITAHFSQIICGNMTHISVDYVLNQSDI